MSARFTVLAGPGSDPAAAAGRASAVVPVDGPAAVAAAARAAADPYLLLLAPGAVPHPDAFGGLAAALRPELGVLGGTTHSGPERLFGWMLAPAPRSPLPFALEPVGAPEREAGVDALVRGPLDVVAPGMLLAARGLLLEPLVGEPVAALVELCARARAAGLEVVCRPAFRCSAPALDRDDRGRAAALWAVAELQPAETGRHRLPPNARARTIERVVRSGGQRRRRRLAQPPLSVLVHGAGTAGDPLAALRAAMRVRGDRYLLVADAACVPSPAAVADLIEAVEEDGYVAIAAPDAASLDGRCALLALRHFPQHVEPTGPTMPAALASLVAAATALRRAVRAPGYRARPVPPAPQPRLTVVFLAASLPEITRLTLDALLSNIRPGDAVVAVCAGEAATARRVLAAYPQISLETDPADPFLTGAVNRAIAAARTEAIVVLADDVLLPAGTLDRLRAAFGRIPALGAALPAVPAAAGGGGETVADVTYADLAELGALAERRARTAARTCEPIDVAGTPAIAVAAAAFAAVGGIAPAYGPTRRGIADLVLRLRAAGYAVVRCDDALAHRFAATASRAPAALADLEGAMPAADPAAIARGFDPEQRVPFERPGAPAPAAAAEVAIALPLAGPAELEAALAFLGAAARAFDARDPVRVHLLLDGALAGADVAARVRPVLLGSGRPLDQTLAVRIERAADLAAWRAAQDRAVRIVVAAGHRRPALADLAAVTGPALAGLLEREYA